MIGIKEMKMPERCDICAFYYGLNGGTCLISEISYESHSMDMQDMYRQEWCPLIEIDENKDE